MTPNILDIHLDLKKVTDDGTFEGYGSVFNNVDKGHDVVEPGAFKKSLEDWAKKGKLPKMLRDHDPTSPVGVYTEMKEDQHGLWVAGRFTKGVAKATETHLLLKDGAIDGLSIGYRTKDYEIDYDLGVRILKEIDLWEVSIVTMPMNESAFVTAVKNIDSRSLERELRNGLSLSSRDAVRAVSIIKKYLSRDGEVEDLMAAREEKLQDLLAAIRDERLSVFK